MARNTARNSTMVVVNTVFIALIFLGNGIRLGGREKTTLGNRTAFIDFSAN